MSRHLRNEATYSLHRSHRSRRPIGASVLPVRLWPSSSAQPLLAQPPLSQSEPIPRPRLRQPATARLPERPRPRHITPRQRRPPQAERHAQQQAARQTQRQTQPHVTPHHTTRQPDRIANEYGDRHGGQAETRHAFQYVPQYGASQYGVYPSGLYPRREARAGDDLRDWVDLTLHCNDARTLNVGRMPSAKQSLMAGWVDPNALVGCFSEPLRSCREFRQERLDFQEIRRELGTQLAPPEPKRIEQPRRKQRMAGSMLVAAVMKENLTKVHKVRSSMIAARGGFAKSPWLRKVDTSEEADKVDVAVNAANAKRKPHKEPEEPASAAISTTVVPTTSATTTTTAATATTTTSTSTTSTTSTRITTTAVQTRKLTSRSSKAATPSTSMRSSITIQPRSSESGSLKPRGSSTALDVPSSKVCADKKDFGAWITKARNRLSIRANGVITHGARTRTHTLSTHQAH